MWLINVETRKLECFNDERDLPLYAILSHTWTNTEITMQVYRDLLEDSSRQSGYIQTSRGYDKTDRSCQQARADGLPYLWVDTCCIDKTSSAELSEAINSMFRWYQGAVICYVYLDDVAFGDDISYTVAPIEPNCWQPVDILSRGPAEFQGNYSSEGCESAMARWVARRRMPKGLLAPKLVEVNNAPPIDGEKLAKARWFTRGWTLQELIAPKDVVFYDQRWTRIGTKRSLKTDISRITRIHELVLGGKARLRSVDIAQRMTWAAGRATSKVEDKAYSLFGIFGVHMPLLYGEGTKAFTRLQEEILKESDDMSLFAWQPEGGDLSTDPDVMAAWRNEAPAQLRVSDLARGVSIFAEDPQQFYKGSALNNRFFTLAGEHSMVGGKGLKIELPILKIADAPDGPLRVAVIEGTNFYTSYLDTKKISRSFSMGIILEKLSAGHYMRHPFAPLVRVSAIGIKATDLQTIYIRKDISRSKSAPSTSDKNHRTRKVLVKWYDPHLNSIN